MGARGSTARSQPAVGGGSPLHGARRRTSLWPATFFRQHGHWGIVGGYPSPTNCRAIRRPQQLLILFSSPFESRLSDNLFEDAGSIHSATNLVHDPLPTHGLDTDECLTQSNGKRRRAGAIHRRA